MLGVRPDELKVSGADNAPIKGVIDVVELTGPDTMLTVRVVARAEFPFQGRRGDPVAFDVDPLSINAETEDRIELNSCHPPGRSLSRRDVESQRGG